MRALLLTSLSIQTAFSNAWSGYTYSRRDWMFISTLITQDTNHIENTKDSPSTSKDDALASFGRDLSSMKFDNMNNASGGLFDLDTSTSNYPQRPNDNATNDLTNAIEQNRKKRSIDPRTHG